MAASSLRYRDLSEKLVNRLGMANRISFRLNGNIHAEPVRTFDRSSDSVFFPARIGAIDGVQRVEQDGDQVTVYGQGEGWVGEVVMLLQTDHIPFSNLRTEQADLEDVFLALTGRAIRN